MSGLETLSILRRGLAVQQQRLASASRNISEADTPGAQRGVVRVQSGGAQLPTLSAQTVRESDPLGEAQVAGLRALSRFHRGRGELMGAQVADQVTELEDGNLPSALGRFFNAWRDLDAAPTDIARRQMVADATAQLAAEVRQVASGLAASRAQLDGQVVQVVAQAQPTIDALAVLNGNILEAQAAGQPTVDMENRRSQLMRSLSDQVGATLLINDDGSYRPMIGGGLSLVDRLQPHQLTTQVGVADGLHHVVVAPTIDPSVDNWLQLGQLGALVRVRDDELAALQAGLDQFAFDLATGVNGQHRLGFGLDMVGSRDLFQAPAAAPGYAKVMAPDVTVALDPRRLAAAGLAANLPGEADNARAVVALESTLLAAGGTQTLAAQLAGLTFGMGASIGEARGQQALTQTRLEHAESSRERRVGIHRQEEMELAQQASFAIGAHMRMIQMENEAMKLMLGLH